MLDVRAVAPERVRPLKRAEYEHLVDLGAFDDERVELLQGVLVTMSPQGSAHAECLRRLTKILVVALADRATVQIQTPLGAGERSLPEPDVAVVPLGNYANAHPESALLVIEVADSSLQRDRAKATVYATARVAEYWIVNLHNRVVEIHTDPADDRYRNLATRDADSTIAPRAFADLSIRVADLLP